MLFGDKKEFAIECEITGHVGSFHFCHFTFFVNGEAVGDYAEQVTLGVCLFNADLFLKYSNRRLAYVFETMVASEIVIKYYDAVFGTDDAEPIVEQFDSRFGMQDIGGESTRDEYVILLVWQSDGRERMVIKRKTDRVAGNSTLQEAFFSQGAVNSVVESFLNWGNLQVVK